MENVITDIQAQKRNRNRVNIFLDGQYAFSLDRMAAAWLTVGRQLSVEDISRLQEKDEFQTALNRALHFLSYRARSRQEMQTYLQNKGYETGLIDRVIAKLTEERLIDDLDFAQNWVDNRERFRPRSQSLMRLELRQKGVAESEIEQALQISDLDDFALAMKAGKKLSRRYQLLDKPEYDRKLAAALQRRGFSYSVVRECLPLLWKEKSEP
ncbi:MAG: RecX family transcriptional regulator [Candidatus Omnitrophota bacterium]|jgi:regulatory protein